MSLIQEIKNKLFVVLNPWFRDHVIIPRNKKRFKGTNNITLLCNNCSGGNLSRTWVEVYVSNY